MLAIAAIVYLLIRPTRPDFSRLRGEENFNVILITLDTTRADRLGCYGFSRIETPAIDGWAARGVKFETCIAPTPLTLPSHSSIFTGALPLFHGVRDNGGFILPEELTTMTEVFKSRGYATGAFIGAYVLDSKWGLGQGFDFYFDRFDLGKFDKISLGTVQRPGNEVMDEALRWLEEKRGADFFAWIHLYDPHTPYEPPPPFAAKYAGNPYLGEIAFVDSQLARLEHYLDKTGLAEDSFIVIAGDHGESLGEHEEATHGFFIYQEAIHVPLIFVTPFSVLQGVSAPAVVSLIDIMPTALEMAGLPVPGQVQGESLVPFFFQPEKEAGRYVYSETYYPRFHYGWSELRGFQNKRQKLILAPQKELYDLAADPDETRNLALIESGILNTLDAAAAGFIEERSRNAYELDIRKVDPETRERLAALGYVGSFTDSSKLEDKVLANPKEKIVVFNELSRAREMGMRGRADEAVAVIQRILVDDPEISDAYFAIGNIHFKARKYRDAIPYFEKALELKPDDTFCVINIANSYLNMGRPGDGENFVIDYLKKGFSDPQLYFLLGTLTFIQKKYDEALKYYDECLSHNSDMAAAHNAMAAISIIREDLVRAENHIAAAMAIDPGLSNLNYNRAELLEKQGRLQEAAEAYREELKNSPYHYKASFNLSRVFRMMGRADEEERCLRSTMEINPEFPLSYFYLARLYLNRGTDYEEAIRLTEKGIELRPDPKDLPLGYFLLADLYSRLGDPKRAAEYARKGREITGRK
ncbi:MAG: sulfatase-like hydrolase/transferase [Candidatus Aminicenantes bacterium]|nr:sulfatase-like hydrolase/transferase [Candidatus Aminicenantes bacterium]